MKDVRWHLDMKGRLVVDHGNMDDARVRSEVRADAQILANTLKRPIAVLDPTDPIRERVAEVVEPAGGGLVQPRSRAFLPATEVDDDEPGITRDRVMRRV